MKQKRQKHNNKNPSIETRAGRIPIYDERMAPHTINMPEIMYERLGNEAEARNLAGGQSEMARSIFQWFFDALDRQRGDAQDNKIFDEVLAITK